MKNRSGGHRKSQSISSFFGKYESPAPKMPDRKAPNPGNLENERFCPAIYKIKSDDPPPPSISGAAPPPVSNPFSLRRDRQERRQPTLAKKSFLWRKGTLPGIPHRTAVRIPRTTSCDFV